MPTLRVITARRALSDLNEIWDYTAIDASPEVASKVIDKILTATEMLAQMPGLGHRRADLAKRYRVWRVFRFLVIYRFDARTLYVERVIHGHRDIGNVVKG